MDDYILPTVLTEAQFDELGYTLGEYMNNQSKELRDKLHEVAIKVGCTIREIYWCQHIDCVESLECFNTEKELKDHEQDHEHDLDIDIDIDHDHE